MLTAAAFGAMGATSALAWTSHRSDPPAHTSPRLYMYAPGYGAGDPPPGFSAEQQYFSRGIPYTGSQDNNAVHGLGY
jgi:hypothetical protein